ncbi:MAG: carboxylesterase family protein, partial [Chitinophagia bacterium]|nr:carboxylesterase family protein [Chitinophagia bacterium]
MKKIFALLLVGFVATSYAQPATVVNIESGKISGKTTDDGAILSYKGIPFAEPPVGDLRWRAPRPVKAWQGIKECTRFSASPMQSPPVPFSMWSEEFLIPKEPIGEDCLYLNVWTAAKSDNKKRPVLVWIYGGGFRSGGSACPIYDGEAMARKGIIFVSINYRVGILGFFAHPGLASDGEKSG